MRLFLQISLLLIFIFELAACASVSVDIKPKAPERSTHYTVQDPEDPFDEFDSEQADKAWQNPNTGNTIAVISECSDRDPELKSVEEETMNAMTNPKILQTNSTIFSNREALRTMAQGQVDGVTVKMDLLTFKKNSCVYTLSQLGRDKGFEKDHKAFENFLKGFKLP